MHAPQNPGELTRFGQQFSDSNWELTFCEISATPQSGIASGHQFEERYSSPILYFTVLIFFDFSKYSDNLCKSPCGLRRQTSKACRWKTAAAIQQDPYYANRYQSDVHRFTGLAMHYHIIWNQVFNAKYLCYVARTVNGAMLIRSWHLLPPDILPTSMIMRLKCLKQFFSVWSSSFLCRDPLHRTWADWGQDQGQAVLGSIYSVSFCERGGRSAEVGIVLLLKHVKVKGLGKSPCEAFNTWCPVLCAKLDCCSSSEPMLQALEGLKEKLAQADPNPPYTSYTSSLTQRCRGEEIPTREGLNM